MPEGSGAWMSAIRGRRRPSPSGCRRRPCPHRQALDSERRRSASRRHRCRASAGRSLPSSAACRGRRPGGPAGPPAASCRSAAVCSPRRRRCPRRLRARSGPCIGRAGRGSAGRRSPAGPHPRPSACRRRGCPRRRGSGSGRRRSASRRRSGRFQATSTWLAQCVVVPDDMEVLRGGGRRRVDRHRHGRGGADVALFVLQPDAQLGSRRAVRASRCLRSSRRSRRLTVCVPSTTLPAASSSW